MRRNTTKLKEWRKAVRKRDQYKCRKCTHDEDLNVHHLNCWANGITLCARCHYLFHEVYMGSARTPCTKEDMDDFLKTFKASEDHPINLSKFKFYLKTRRVRRKRKYKK